MGRLSWGGIALLILSFGCEAGFVAGRDAPEKPEGHLLNPSQFADATPEPKNPQAMIAELRKRLDADENDVEARIELAKANMMIGEFGTAKEMIERGLELAPDHPDLLRALGEVALYVKDVDLAISAREKLIQKHPDRQDVDGIYREIYYLRLFDRLGDDEEKGKAYFGAVQKGNALEKQGKLAEAAAAYREGLEIIPDDPHVRMDLAIVLREDGKLDEAIAELKKTIEVDPDHMAARLELARTQAKAGKTEDAQATLRALKGKNAGAATRLQVDARLARLADGGEFDDRVLLAMNGNDSMDPRSVRDVARSGAVMGTVQLGPAVADAATNGVLFIYARKGMGAMGPPLAVKQIRNPTFPLRFELSSDDMMIEGRDFSGEVYISARLDNDGNASTKNDGDLQSAVPIQATVGGEGVAVTLDQRLGDKSAPKDSGGSGSKAIRGTITLDKSLKAPAGATLYVYARLRPEGGPPMAVKQVRNPKFPYEFALTENDAMMPGTTLEGDLYLIVRLDQDGNAMSKEDGDLEAKPTKVTVGAPAINVVIDQVRGGHAAGTNGNPHGGGGTSAGGSRIEGTIEISSQLAKEVPKGSVLFLYAKRGPDQGPPLAVQRFTDLTFPLKFSLGPENSMIKGMELNGKVYLTARIDGDGNAMSKNPGDLVNEPLQVDVGDEDVKVMIDKKL